MANTQIRALCAGLLVTGLLAGIGGWPAAAQSGPFRAGERLTYDVRWSAMLAALTAGTVTLEVTEQRTPDGLAFGVVGEARLSETLSRLYQLYYRADTLVDARTLLPLEGSIHSEEGRRQRTKVTRFDRAAQRAHYEIRTATVVTRELAVPMGVQDALSALYVMRAMPWAPGEFRIPVSDGGKLYTVVVTVGGREQIRTSLGTQMARQASIRVVEDGVGPVDRRLDLWVSDDTRRLPLKIEVDLPIGSVVLLLRELA